MAKSRSSLFFLLLFTTSFCQADDDIARSVAASDVAKGEKLAIICQACHSFDKEGANRIGPALHNVVGRKIASVSSYKYSDAMANTKGTWDLKTLDKYLTEPMKMVPGTLMVFPGIKDASDRAALLAWLRLQSDKPIPLPTLSEKEKAKIAVDTKSEDPNLALLPKGVGREEVYYKCSVCHSIRLVVQQGLSRSSWKESLDWMVSEQEMTPLEPKSEKLILDYLAEHFGIDNK